jgi:broad-specificity NMP kinase
VLLEGAAVAAVVVQGMMVTSTAAVAAVVVLRLEPEVLVGRRKEEGHPEVPAVQPL